MFSLFTIIPVDSNLTDFEALSRRFWLLPVMGAFFGVMASVALLALSQVFSLLLSSVLVLLMMEVANRFLHFDGLMDLGDGLVAHGDQERKLVAMKDSSIGAGGVAFALFFTLLTVAAYSSLPTDDTLILLVAAPFAAEVLSRNSMLACTAMGRPRPGLGSTFVSNTTRRSLTPSLVLSIALVIAFWSIPLVIVGSEAIHFVEAILISIILAVVSSLVGIVMSIMAMRSFGCVNGDVIGATNEIARPVMLMTILLVVLL